MPTITLAAKTDVGLVRQNNEDSFVALGGEKSPPGLDALLVVADGMGGHAAGEVASRMAVEGVVRMMDVDGTSYWKLLEEVNREIHQAGEDSDKAGMGTTCTVAAISGGTLYLAHVGDSRAYLFRDGALHQLTKDHSWVEHAVTQGMSQDEAKTHPNRHVITRALGLEPQVTVENQQMPLSDGDLILVCSDGLHGLVEDEEIASVLTNNGPEGACEALVEVAKGYGGDDNITVAVARVHLLGAETQKIPKGRLARIVRLLRLRTRY